MTPPSTGVAPARASDRVVLAIGSGAAAATVLAYWMPLFQVGGYVYTPIDAYWGGQQFVAAVVFPLIIALSVPSLLRRVPVTAFVVAASALVIVTLALVDHMTEAWRRGDPERFGQRFELRGGFLVAVVAVGGGAIAFAGVVRALSRRRNAPAEPTIGDGRVAVAAVGLLLVVAGYVSASSKAHLWALPLVPQLGRWWELLVTTTLCGVVLWQRTGVAVAAAVPAALTGTAVEVQQLIAVTALDDDPAVSTMTTLAGFALVAVVLTPPLVRVVRADSVDRRA